MSRRGVLFAKAADDRPRCRCHCPLLRAPPAAACGTRFATGPLPDYLENPLRRQSSALIHTPQKSADFHRRSQRFVDCWLELLSNLGSPSNKPDGCRTIFPTAVHQH